MDSSKLNTKESIALILVVAITHSLLAIPQSLLTEQKSAVLINIIYVGIIALLFAYLVYKILKNFPSKDIIDISEYLGGKTFKTIIGIIFILYFSVGSSLLLRNFCESLKIVYFQSTNISFILIMFITAAVCVCNLDFKANLKTNLIIMPLVLVSMLFLFFSNFDNFTPERIFPILGEGAFNTFITGLGSLFSFGGIVFLYFLPPMLNKPKTFKRITLLSVLLSMIYLIMTVSIVLFMFTYFINIDEIMPLFSATRNIEFGSFFQRLESLFLLIWMIVFDCYISITMSFSIQIFKKLTKISDTKPITLSFGFFYLAIAVLPSNYAVSKYFETNIYPYLVIGVVFILSFAILLLSYWKKKKLSYNNIKAISNLEKQTS